jgi:DNA-binding XRE family transcriptional regulator
MFHKAMSMSFLDGTSLELLFQDGKVKQFDMASLFSKYPQLERLKDRALFLSGKLMGHYGIIWDDELDIETETIYEEGITVRVEMISHSDVAARAVAYARSLAGISQKELSSRTGIDQADISKIERSVANPSISTLERIASALGGELVIEIRMGEEKHK